MEVDMHAPASMATSFTAPRASTSTTKRPRSPASCSTSEPPSKRLSFGIAEHENAHSRIVIPLPQIACPPYGRLRTSEDWVAQTRTLRIGSPLVMVGSSFPRIPENDSSPQKEEDASMTDVQMSICSPARTARSLQEERTGAESFASPNQPDMLPQPELQGQFLRPPEPLYPAPQQQYQAQLQIPSIQIHDATPSPVHAPELTPASTQGGPFIPPAPAEEPIQRQAQAQAQGPAGRKQRFTMGPRADCEKCRLGVRGHWMHFD
ncbi:hypothetical protein SCP_0409940 [Sparassis crispa]|uniref:Uncharacterized protein n=1 Tax=Sparassis crispa TaxID=139825 RepID=A0A401GKD2_9APHY|nr:hypothetical protein SCP_0409940 [Sparassis crispa]GBE82609.1 hypothetical protein SCP_0409940 [Sparassis crispa]